MPARGATGRMPIPNPVTASPGSSPADDDPVAAQASSRQPAATTSAPSDRICRPSQVIKVAEHRGEEAHPDRGEHHAGEQRGQLAALLQVQREHEEERRWHQREGQRGQ